MVVDRLMVAIMMEHEIAEHQRLLLPCIGISKY